MLPTQVRANWPFQTEEVKNRFSRWSPWPLSWISDWKDFIYLFIFFLSTSHPMLLTKFQVNWPFSSGEEAKNRFSRCGHFVFPIGTISAIFDLQVTLMLPTKFPLAFWFRRRSENRFSRWSPLPSSWVGTILAIFYLQVIMMLPTKFRVN